MSVIRCLDVAGTLTAADRQRRRVEEFTVPHGATRLRIEFSYRPGEFGGIRNLLTLALFGPRGFRGAAHRWSQNQEIVVDVARATPGFLRGPITAGGWRVELDAHEIVGDGSLTGSCTFNLLVEATDELAVAGRSQPARRARRRPAAVVKPNDGWYRGDLHSHSTHCDGTSTIADMATAAANAGLDFLATTGHNTISQWRDLEPWPPDLMLIRGVECTTYFGHANVLGTSDWIDWRVESVESGARSILAQANRQGGFAVVNHPFAEANPRCTGCRWDYPADELEGFDAIELWNGHWLSTDTDNAAALSLWTTLLMAGHRVAAVAGTDAHSAEEYQTEGLAYTWVYASALSEGAILGALRAGRCYLSRGPILSFVAWDAQGRLASLPGDRLGAGPLAVSVEIAGLDRDAVVWLIADGVAMQSGRVSAAGGSVSLRSAAERWWRIEIREDDQSAELLAITNPILQSA
jgi:hypothetical protein